MQAYKLGKTLVKQRLRFKSSLARERARNNNA
jgi:hypothetical protein